MISSISKLKNFGIFSKFNWNKELPDFEKYNLIYGWNRSGKTTLSRVFASCEKKCTYDEKEFTQYPEKGEFEMKIEKGITIDDKNVSMNEMPIKVFNRDFIDRNIYFDRSDTCEPIVYVSEEDIEIKNKLGLLRSQVKTLSDKCPELKKISGQAQKAEDDFRISVANTITVILTEKAKEDRYYSYHKGRVKEKIDEIGIDNFSEKILPDEEKEKCKVINNSDKRGNLEEPLRHQFSSHFGEEMTDCFEKVKNLLRKEVVSETLERLKEDQELNAWVKKGFDLHNNRKDEYKCLFVKTRLIVIFYLRFQNTSMKTIRIYR